MAKGERSQVLGEIGSRVRQRRRELNMTQEQLADAAGLSKSFVSEVEGGLTAASGLLYLKIAQALDLDVQWVLTGEEREAPQSRQAERIPSVLSALAEERGWSHRLTMEIAAALNVIVARRTRGGQRWEPSRELILSMAKELGDGDAP